MVAPGAGEEGSGAFSVPLTDAMFDECIDSHYYKNLDGKSRKELRSLVTPCFTDTPKVQQGQGNAQGHTAG